MLQQLRTLSRGLRRAPAFTAAAVLCVALGIGANTAIFSAVSAVLLRPVATPDVDRLVAVRQDLIPLKLLDIELAPPEVLDLAERRELFASVAGFVSRGFVLEHGGTSTRFEGVRTLGDYFGVFRVRPHLGRLYTADDSRDGRHQVAVLTYGLWREQFGGDPSVIGRSVRLNDASHEIVGVLPPEFRYPRNARILLPVRIDSGFARSQRGRQYITAVARLRDGVTPEQAQAGLQSLMASWRDRYAQASYGVAGQHRMYLTPFVAFDAGQLRPVLLVLLGAVGVVLLVACANVASLQLVRATSRTRELAVRAALGAERGSLVRRLLGESALLAALGGALGLVIGWAATRLLVWLAPAEQLALRDLRLDAPVLLGTVLATAAAALISGTLPALRGSRVDLRGALQEGARGASVGRERHRVLHTAVVAQVALSFVLLLGSGVMLRSMARLLEVDPGFRAARVTTAAITLPFERYAKTTAAIGFYDRLTERLRATPGVEGVGITTWLPMRDGGGSSSPFRVIGRDTTGQGEPPHANLVAVNGEYFRAMGIPLLRGRTFGGADATPPTSGASTMSFIIDEQLARQYFPNEDPIGKRLNQGPDGVIVGVVGSVRQEGLGQSHKATIYYHYQQGWWSNFTVAVRSTLSDDAAARALRGAVAALDPQVPVYSVARMPDVVSESIGTRRFGVVVLAGFALVSVTLALLGVYGVLSYVVLQRRRELGIRAALGASRSAVARLVLGQGARLAGVGLAAGAVVFLAVGRGLESLVYGVGPRDPVTLLAGAGLLGAAALLASWIPARRAARIDPATSLRSE
jgi:putative ABC transport system permease protein